MRSRLTYTRELDAAVAALGGSAALLDVQNTQLAARSLDHTRPVGRGVIAARKICVSRSVRLSLFVLPAQSQGKT